MSRDIASLKLGERVLHFGGEIARVAAGYVEENLLDSQVIVRRW